MNSKTTAAVVEAPSRDSAATNKRTRRPRAKSSLLSRGEPMVWLTGGALALSLGMIVGLLGLVLWQGSLTFWPVPLVQITTLDGRQLLGELTRTESFPLNVQTLSTLPELDESRGPELLHRRMTQALRLALAAPARWGQIETECWKTAPALVAAAVINSAAVNDTKSSVDQGSDSSEEPAPQRVPGESAPAPVTAAPLTVAQATSALAPLFENVPASFGASWQRVLTQQLVDSNQQSGPEVFADRVLALRTKYQREAETFVRAAGAPASEPQAFAIRALGMMLALEQEVGKSPRTAAREVLHAAFQARIGTKEKLKQDLDRHAVDASLAFSRRLVEGWQAQLDSHVEVLLRVYLSELLNERSPVLPAELARVAAESFRGPDSRTTDQALKALEVGPPLPPAIRTAVQQTLEAGNWPATAGPGLDLLPDFEHWLLPAVESREPKSPEVVSQALTEKRSAVDAWKVAGDPELVWLKVLQLSLDPGWRVQVRELAYLENLATLTKVSSDRSLIRTGNFDLTNEHFSFAQALNVADEVLPKWAVIVERMTWGRFYGTPKQFVVRTLRTPAEAPLARVVKLLEEHRSKVAEERWNELEPELAKVRAEVARAQAASVAEFMKSLPKQDDHSSWELVLADGSQKPRADFQPADVVQEARQIWQGPEAAWAEFREIHSEVRHRSHQAESLKKYDLGALNARIAAARLGVNQVELSVKAQLPSRLTVEQQRRAQVKEAEAPLRLAAEVEQTLSDRFGQDSPLTKAVRELAATQLRASVDEATRELRAEQTQADEELAQLGSASVRAFENYFQVYDDAQVEIRAVAARIEALHKLNEGYALEMETVDGAAKALPVAEIVRAYPANQLTVMSKLWIYGGRWVEFLFDEPREANSEGGVFPAIWGTVAMTLLMTVMVVPFGVLAALFLREYAKAGPIVSAIRVAINNLAGVPSIVFGVFGLGFFCHQIGGTLDQMFWAASLPDPTFGKGGLFWASLTLALLTLPVVIVATEEALAAVPKSMREGSYACGASKWQTIWRIVLPRAMPGIMTGMILALARGAGEVAPLMLVGAVKLSPDLPLDWVPPFMHWERTFMHLGFQIFDVGFQSQNSEASKPMVFTSTLLLIAIVTALNIVAIWLRSHLRKRFAGSAF